MSSLESMSYAVPACLRWPGAPALSSLTLSLSAVPSPGGLVSRLSPPSSLPHPLSLSLSAVPSPGGLVSRLSPPSSLPHPLSAVPSPGGLVSRLSPPSPSLSLCCTVPRWPGAPALSSLTPSLCCTVPRWSGEPALSSLLPPSPSLSLLYRPQVVW